MSLRDLLLYVTGKPGAEVSAALEIARAHDAHVTALHVVDIPATPMVVETSAPSSVLEAQRRNYANAAGEAKRRTTLAAERAGAQFEWRLAEGKTVWQVSQHSRYCDLVVMGAQAGNDEPPFDRALAEHTVLECAKPVVIVPERFAAGDFGRFVTVAWNGSPEAARAVADAIPLLRKAEKVSVAVINPSKLAHGLGDVPGADICSHLSRHGVQAEAQTVVSGDTSTGKAIVDWAKGQGASLIVMGAYGHWRLRELVLGGATRDVLREAGVPVLMSH